MLFTIIKSGLGIDRRNPLHVKPVLQPGTRRSSTFSHIQRPRLTLKKLFWFAWLALLSACAHDYDLMKMEDQVSGYGAAIRWNLFKKAVGYLDPPPERSPDWAMLAETKVTSYTLQFRDILPSGKVMMQSVEIRYIPPGSVVEKTIIDHQRWHFDEDTERWVLETGLPALD